MAREVPQFEGDDRLAFGRHGDQGRRAITGIKALGRWPGMGWLPIKVHPGNSPAPAVAMCQ
jgi:hypothetical protein